MSNYNFSKAYSKITSPTKSTALSLMRKINENTYKAILAAPLTENFLNKTLHPDFWTKDNTFIPEIREKLLTVAKDLANDVEIMKYVRDIHLTGSLANYNYTKFSDLDVHILLDFSDINKDEALVKDALDGKRFIWNERHNIVIHDHDVELYFQDIDEPHEASGLYSLLNDKWIRVPKYEDIEIDERDVNKKAEQFSSDIDKLEKEIISFKLDPKESQRLYNRGSKLKDRITTMRKDSLTNDGEFGIGNLAFKQLRNSGAIEKLIAITNKAYDNVFSESV